MTQTQKYIWLLNTIHQSGECGISLREISDKWLTDQNYSDKPLDRATFNRWKDAIQEHFDLILENEKTPPYRYYITNPETLLWTQHGLC